VKLAISPRSPAAIQSMWSMALAAAPNIYDVTVAWDLQKAGDESDEGGFTLMGTSNVNVVPSVSVHSVTCA